MSTLSRRDFITRTTLAASASALCGPQLLAASSKSQGFPPPILAFSKVYQELKLDFDAAADLTAEAGLAGVDSPVRPKGEILPENAADQLPRYVEALRKRNLTMPYISSGVVSADTPAESLLRTAKKLGIRYYRLGFWHVDDSQPREKQLAEINAKLKEIAAMNKDLGICAIFQNHSPTGNRHYIGGKLADFNQLLKDIPASQVGIAFDFGHALIVHGDEWRTHFEKIKSHIKVVYVKDADRVKRFVKFGEGEYGKSGYFTLLKKMGYNRPFSMHIEYPWAPKGQPKTRALLLETLKQSAACINRWASEA